MKYLIVVSTLIIGSCTEIFLVAGADINVKDKDGHTPIFMRLKRL